MPGAARTGGPAAPPHQPRRSAAARRPLRSLLRPHFCSSIPSCAGTTSSTLFLAKFSGRWVQRRAAMCPCRPPRAARCRRRAAAAPCQSAPRQAVGAQRAQRAPLQDPGDVPYVDENGNRFWLSEKGEWVTQDANVRGRAGGGVVWVSEVCAAVASWRARSVAPAHHRLLRRAWRGSDGSSGHTGCAARPEAGPCS